MSDKTYIPAAAPRRPFGDDWPWTVATAFGLVMYGTEDPWRPLWNGPVGAARWCSHVNRQRFSSIFYPVPLPEYRR